MNWHIQIVISAIAGLLFSTAQAQQAFDPVILILTPNQVQVDKGLKTEVAHCNQEIQAGRAAAMARIREQMKEEEGAPANQRWMNEKKLEFLGSMDVFGSLSALCADFVQHGVLREFENGIVFAVNEKTSGTVEELSSLAQKFDAHFVINFPRVHCSLAEGKKVSTVAIQVFERSQQRILLEAEYAGHATPFMGEYDCEEGSLNCTFSNVMLISLGEITQPIMEDSGRLARVEKLEQARQEVLFRQLYSLPAEPEIARAVALQEGAAVREGYYKGWIHESGNRFIGFFLIEEALVKEGSILSSGILSDNTMTRLDPPQDSLTGFCGFMVVGVRHESEWYLMKREVTTLNAKSAEEARKRYFSFLSGWNYFLPGSAEFNPAFWETGYFARKRTAAEENKLTIAEYEWMKERAASPEDKGRWQALIDDLRIDDWQRIKYMGLYEIVVNVLTDRVTQENEKFEARFAEEVLLPAYKKRMAQSNPVIAGIEQLNPYGYALIYPESKQIVLSPVRCIYANGKPKLQYFVFCKNESGGYDSYRWNYFDFQQMNDARIETYTVNEQISSLFRWDFSFDYLENETFWNEYVLKKSSGEYLYLSEPLR